jgi:hypothetical protein
MSHPSRPRPRGAAPRRRRAYKTELLLPLESRRLLAPVVNTTNLTATVTATTTTATTTTATVAVTPTSDPLSAAPYTSVSELTPLSAFGGDIVRIKAGPGGDFGKVLYAISRGAGDNASSGAINRPGVIYRVDPVTGKASVFFDLNTVISQLEPGGNASNSLGNSTGLVNWYDIAFDPEGYFDGRPSMFVASVDAQDPNKNGIYQIAPDGTFLGFFSQFQPSTTSGLFTQSPSAVFVTPVEQQSFLRGLFAGDGTPTTNVLNPNLPIYTTLFFNANQFQPGTPVVGPTLPTGVSTTAMNLGPQVGITGADAQYADSEYAAFTNFGKPGGGGIPGTPGFSGVQGLSGDLLINGGVAPASGSTSIDLYPIISSEFRRFEDIAYDYYGYFSWGAASTVSGSAGGPINVTFPNAGVVSPTFAGSLFVSDLATGLAVNVTAPGATAPTLVPVQGPGSVTVATNGTVTLNTSNLGGRIIRITPSGQINVFASGFHTNGAASNQAFLGSELSITFSADGTTLYASDDDAIWEFRSALSLADSQAGQYTGLSDLRTLNVPYEGQNSAIDIIDTGVDATTPNFRGRVAPGVNILTNGPGNNDTAPTSTTSSTTGGGGGIASFNNFANGHGTPLAGIVAQFVPQATINPINTFSPFTSTTTSTVGTTTMANNALTTNQDVYNAFNYAATHPYVADPVRPGQQDRVIAAAIGFGTRITFATEQTAFRHYPQLVIAFKNEMKQLRSLGIQPIAPAGQLPSNGAPVFGTGIGGTVSTTIGNIDGMALPAVLNEVISVTGTYPFPFLPGSTTPPTNPSAGFIPRPTGPAILYGIGGASIGAGASSGDLANLIQLTNADQAGGIYAGKILQAVNLNTYTDYTAPAVDVPTFRRTIGTPQTNPGYNVFHEAGTSMAAGIVTGAYAVVESALSYWSQLNASGVTTDPYLTTPVGVTQLNFGKHAFKDLSAYANPDGINAILQWTAIPNINQNLGTDTNTPQPLIGSTTPPAYSGVNVANAIAAIEGTEAINYLLDHNIFPIIDANHDGLITAQELQNFEDNANAMGLPEAGAMARLLGGTEAATLVSPGLDGYTPGEPNALQRRFNFFDYAADGQLNGSISIAQYQMLAHTLLPSPDAFVVVDRQRASMNHYLLDPNAFRNYTNLQHLKPSYVWVPPGKSVNGRPSYLTRFRNVSPAQFGIGGPRRFRLSSQQLSPLLQAPGYSLFAGTDGGNAGSSSSSSSSNSSQVVSNASQVQSSSAASQGTSGQTSGAQGQGSSTSGTTSPSGSIAQQQPNGQGAGQSSTGSSGGAPASSTSSTTTSTSSTTGSSSSSNTGSSSASSTGTPSSSSTSTATPNAILSLLQQLVGQGSSNSSPNTPTAAASPTSATNTGSSSTPSPTASNSTSSTPAATTTTNSTNSATTPTSATAAPTASTSAAATASTSTTTTTATSGTGTATASTAGTGTATGSTTSPGTPAPAGTVGTTSTAGASVSSAATAHTAAPASSGAATPTLANPIPAGQVISVPIRRRPKPMSRADLLAERAARRAQIRTAQQHMVPSQSSNNSTNVFQQFINDLGFGSLFGTNNGKKK